MGYVMPREQTGLNAGGTVKKRQTQTQGRGRPASKATGLRPAGRVAKPSMRSRRSQSHLIAAAKMAGQNLARPGYSSLVPEVVVSSPEMTERRSSFEKGDDAVPLLSPKEVRPLTPVVSWTAHSSLFVTNPDDGASVCSGTTVASSQADEVPESYDDFKAKLDRPTGDIPPRLQFLPHLPPIDLDATAPFSPEMKMEDIQLHRDDALRRLEGGGVVAQEALLASTIPVPLRDVPAALKPQQHPHSLLPGPRYKDHEGVERVRPFTYQERPPPAWKFEDPLSLETKDYNYTMKWRRARPDSPPVETKKPRFWKGKEKVVPAPLVIPRPRAKTPESFASKAQHKSFYDCVESGFFDDAAMVGDRSSGNSIGHTFLDSPTPPSSRVPSAEVVRGARVTKKPLPTSSSTPNLARKPLPPPPLKTAQKPLPPTPAPPTTSTVPARHRMNDNGYPVSDLRLAGARYSSTPSYQRRTVDVVEAKLQKDIPRSRTQKEAAKVSKLEAKAAKKAEKEREKYELLVRKQKEIEAGVRRLVYV